jgi:hypothetical protein
MITQLTDSFFPEERKKEEYSLKKKDITLKKKQ